ncbi:MAG: alpha/beta-type small acid-soluble spore protein, partial [Oscillospiraceae bacterium]|nr:alpha/beta-type small acid-soluble spore protein [Oscillospiraceae bacterium]
MSKKNNRINVPEAREAMDKFKMEAASEVGVNLKQGYNGDISAREAGSVGGQMVKKMTPVRTASFTRTDRTAAGHVHMVEYRAA